MTNHNPFGCGGGEYPLDSPNPMTTFPRTIYKNSDFKHQLVHLVQNIYKNLSDPQRGASLVGYSEDMTVREVLDFLLGNSENGSGNILELLEGKVDKVEGKGLSEEDFTTTLRDKLESLNPDLSGIISIVAGSGISVDDSDPSNPIVSTTNDGGGGTSPVTAPQVKQLYESNPDTNAFTDADVLTLARVQSQIDDLAIDDVQGLPEALNERVQSIVPGSGINVDVSDPANPIINATGNVGTEVNVQTGTSYTLVLSDAFKMVTMDNADANTITVPPNSAVVFPVNTRIDLGQDGAGQTTIAAGDGVTIRTPETLKLRKQWSKASLIRRAADVWDIVGDLEAEA